MSDFPSPVPLSDEGELDLAKVLRVNQSWIVRGQLKENATAWIEHLERIDPQRLEKSCWLALFLTRYKKSVIRDPKPLFYAGLFAFASPEEIRAFLPEHPMTHAIALLLRHDSTGRDALNESARPMADAIAAEIGRLMAMQ